MSYLFHNLIYLSAIVASIGASDGLEFIISPLVHEIHNCPDIIRKPWAQYNIWDAAWSGILCCWWILFFAAIPIEVDSNVVMLLSFSNVLLPLVIWMAGADSKNPFLCHEYLYTINTIGIGWAYVRTALFNQYQK